MSQNVDFSTTLWKQASMLKKSSKKEETISMSFSAFHSAPRESELPLSSSTHPRKAKLEFSAKVPLRLLSDTVTTSLEPAVILSNSAKIRRIRLLVKQLKVSPRRPTELYSFLTAITMKLTGNSLRDRQMISRL